MRFAIAITITAALLLSGCASLFAEPSAGKAHIADMDGLAKSKLDNPVFFGLMGVEGHIDIEKFLDVAKEEMDEEGEDPSVLDKFEFRFENGELGDGRTGAWFGAYAEADADRFLLVQSVAGGLRHHLFDFEDMDDMEEAEAEAAGGMAQLMPMLGSLDILQRKASSQVEACDDEIRSKVTAGIDSDKAARIAKEQEVFRNHTQANPDADYIYLYIPELTYCWGDDVETEPAMWAVLNTDIDKWMDFETREPTLAYVVMDAKNGTVIDAGVEVPLEWTFEHLSIKVTGPVLFPPIGPAAKTTNTITVPENTLDFWVYIMNLDGAIEHWFVDPSGDRVDLRASGGAYSFEMEAPEAGKWVLHSQFSHRPLEERNAEAQIMFVSEQQDDN